MKKINARAVVFIASVFAFVGCAKQSSTLKPANESEPNPSTTMEASADARINELQQRIAELESQNKFLPGRDAREHRRLMAQTFMRISQILPLLERPEPGGAF